MFAFSSSRLERLVLIMNNKQNRHMRQLAFADAERSWLAGAVGEKAPSAGLVAYRSDQAYPVPRRVLFIRLAQSWDDLLRAIPRWHLADLTQRTELKVPTTGFSVSEIEAVLKGAGVDLIAARELYGQLGGDDGVKALNNISTTFNALPLHVLDALAAHARWQVLACHAIYWKAAPAEHGEAVASA
jgi:hypothetical protein